MKKRFKSACGLCFFFVIRGAERLLSVRVLHGILNAFAFVRAGVNTTFKKIEPLPLLPEFLRSPRTRRAARQFRQNHYLGQCLRHFPDRLAEAKWMNGCEFEGLDRLRQARESRRPIVLTFCHFGPYFLLPFWLRATGAPAAALLGGTAAKRTGLLRLQNRFCPFPKIPTAVYQDQLRQAAEFVAAGKPLLVSFDTPVGKWMSVPWDGDWTFQMATHAMRLAVRHRAELIPCSITDLGRWRFRIRLGRPVPDELLATDAGRVRAGKHLLDEMLPVFQAHPEQAAAHFMRCWKRNSPGAEQRMSEVFTTHRPDMPLPQAATG